MTNMTAPATALWFDLKPIGTADLIAILAALIAFAAFATALLFSRSARKDALRVEKSGAYLSLEVASSDVFKYEAEHSEKLAPYRLLRVSATARKKAIADVANAVFAYNLYFQTLNLFEVCARFRRQDVIEHEVFASWVTWFYDTLDDWYFRDQWADLRGNYTDDVRDIFDLGIALFEEFGDSADAATDRQRRQRFFEWVAAQMQCTEIRDWQGKIETTAVAPPAIPGPLAARLIRLGWKARPTALRQPISSPARSVPTRATSATVKSRAG